MIDVDTGEATVAGRRLDLRALRARDDRGLLPWTSEDLMRLALIDLAAIAAIALAAYQTDRAGEIETQLRWLNLGLVGLMLTGLAQFRWIVRGRRSFQIGLRDVLGRCPTDPITADAEADRGQDHLLGAAGLSHFHRPDCLLARGKDLDAASEDSHRAAGRVPCATCLP